MLISVLFITPVVFFNTLKLAMSFRSALVDNSPYDFKLNVPAYLKRKNAEVHIDTPRRFAFFIAAIVLHFSITLDMGDTCVDDITLPCDIS
jgi:hypothetical protein